jgi:hypothetical protein
VAILRDAYKSPLDAMGRYVTRTELDEPMAISFAADPGIRRRLSVLPLLRPGS